MMSLMSHIYFPKCVCECVCKCVWVCVLFGIETFPSRPQNHASANPIRKARERRPPPKEGFARP